MKLNAIGLSFLPGQPEDEPAAGSPRAAGVQPHLLVLNGRCEGLRFPVGTEVFIGRAAACELRLVDGGISSRHSRLFFQDGQFFIEDLGSTCGTLVNGSDVDRGVVRDQDEIQIGMARLRFVACPAAPEGERGPGQRGA
jgi:pSer/pThr/pTyr-binding forkhead associated (FHA) protein